MSNISVFFLLSPSAHPIGGSVLGEAICLCGSGFGRTSQGTVVQLLSQHCHCGVNDCGLVTLPASFRLLQYTLYHLNADEDITIYFQKPKIICVYCYLNIISKLNNSDYNNNNSRINLHFCQLHTHDEKSPVPAHPKAALLD